MRAFNFILLVLFSATLRAQPPEVVDEWLISAEEAREEGRDGRVLRNVRKVLKADPNAVDALRLGFDAAWNSGANVEAETWSKAWVAHPKGGRRARLARARFLLDFVRPDEALALLAPLLKRSDPEPREKSALDFSAHALAARAHALRGRDAEAEKLLDALVVEAKRVVVRDPEELVALADAYLHFGGWREAQQVLIEAKKRATGKGDEARDVPPAEISLALAQYWLHVHLPQEALEAFDAALKARPRLALAHAGKARAHFILHAEGKARIELRRLSRANPEHPLPRLRTARRLLGDLEIARAEKELEPVLAARPQQIEARALAATARLLASDPEGFQKRLDEILAFDPGCGEALRIAAEILNERRRWPECLAWMRKAVKLDPEDPALWDDLARYALFLGSEKEGAEALARAEKLDAANRVWRRNMRKLARTLERDFETLRTEHFVHRVYKKERKVLEPYLLAGSERSYELLTKRYAYVPEGLESDPGKILVEHFDRHAEFSVRTFGFTNLGALGVCFGPFIAMDSPGAAEDNAWFRTFHHELAHTMTLGMSKGRTPRWLTEGLSTLEEKRYHFAWDRGLYRDLHAAWAMDELLGVEHFDAAFSTPRVIYAYFQAGHVCAFLEESFGWPKVLEFVRAYAKDQGTRAILKEVFGLTPEEFDARFEAYVGKMMAKVALVPGVSAKKFEAAEEALEKNPQDLDALIRCGRALLDRRNLLDAQEFILRAGKMAPEDPRVLHLEGRAALLAKATARARQRFEAAIEKGFEDHDMRMALARITLRSEPEQAVVHLRRAVETFPFANGARDPRVPLARLLLGMQKGEEAIEHLEGHLLTTFGDVEVRQQLIAHYKRKGDLERQAEHLEKLAMLKTKDAGVHLAYGEVLLERKKFGDAEREYRVALELTRGQSAAGEADARVGLGNALLLGGGDAELAIEAAEEALLLVPEHAGAKKLLEVARSAAGQQGRRR